ncbi:MAG: metallophosphoesterase [Anaerolineae bacterium]
MRIGVISDIHDNVWALERVLKVFEGCDELLCLGDLCAPFTLTAIAEGFAGPVHLVWGNNDGDKLLITRNADAAGNVTIYGEVAELERGGRTIAMTHYPVVAKALAAGGTYDLVCYGHNHRRGMQRVGKTLLLNPGEVMGRFGVHSCAIYDTDTGEAEIKETE